MPVSDSTAAAARRATARRASFVRQCRRELGGVQQCRAGGAIAVPSFAADRRLMPLPPSERVR
eukprot:9312174-Alexandrium_andersonii.AAC.1